MDLWTGISIILTLFLGGLGIAYGGYSLDSQHHVLAVCSYALAGCCVVASAVLSLVLWHDLGRPSRVLFAISSAVVSAGLGGALAILWDIRVSPQILFPSLIERVERVTVSLGGAEVIEPIEVLRKAPQSPFEFNGLRPVTLYLEGAVLFVDATIWNATGHASVEVKRNEFVVRPVAWDRNANARALEVVDERQRPVFQLIRRTPTHIMIHGVFPAPDGRVTIATEGLTINNPTGAIPALRPLFRYPSWKYPGQVLE